MPKIHTVLKKIEAKDLGYCQMHEHLCILDGQSAKQNEALKIDDINKSCQELISYKNSGGNAIVDAQPIGCGRDAKFLEKISKKSKVHIISSTGFHKLMFYPENHWIHSMEEKQLSAIFQEELQYGMYEYCDTTIPNIKTNILAGIIKVALDTQGLTGRYEILFSAAVSAQKATNAALMVHIETESDTLGLVKYLQSNNLDLNRVVFCHMDRAIKDLSIHTKVASLGISLEYDTIARYAYHNDEKELAIIFNMLEHNFENKLLMSLDVTRKRLISYGGETGLSFINEKFIPLMKERGITDKQLKKIFYENPENILTIK